MGAIWLAVVGSRDFTDKVAFKRAVAAWIAAHGTPTRIVSGGAPGADTLAERYAKESGIPCTVYAARWRRNGKRDNAPR